MTEQALEWLELMKQTYHELKKIQQLRNKQLQSAEDQDTSTQAAADDVMNTGETLVKLKKPL